MAISVLVESSSVILAAIVIDTNAHGRKTILSIFYGITACFALVTFFMDTAILYVVFATGTKIAMDVCVFY